MALLVDLLALVLATATTLTLLPYVLGFIGRRLGANLRSRSQQRRELLLSRAAAEERASPIESGRDAAAATKPPSSTSLDEEWEKVDRGPETSPTPRLDADFDGIVGFFHPFCNAGGGGERVLFAAILATQQQYPKALCAVYTGDHDASKEQILNNARIRFNIALNPAHVCFLYLTTREYVLASKWPHFTLLGQSLGSLVLGWDAFHLLPPDIFIDTMGYAFTLALSKWLFPSVPTAAYVHYPTISTDMLSSLHDQVEGRGLNAGLGKGVKGKLKQIYWELFAKLYSWVGGSVDVVMTNSTWTQRHVSSLWGRARTSRGKKHAISVVYPPCAVAELQERIPVTAETEQRRTPDILYIAQFRPEKMHHVVIDAFHTFLKSSKHLAQSSPGTDTAPQPNLILVGSVRDDQDEKRVYKLRLHAQENKDRVRFMINAKWDQILELLETSSVGVNGMWNEHFGICVVEYQAAGLISVVNDSGGPKEDIVVDIDGKPTGFHATTSQEFADGFAKALSLSPEEALAMRQRAQKSSWRFSEHVFSDAWTSQMETLVQLADPAAKKTL